MSFSNDNLGLFSEFNSCFRTFTACPYISNGCSFDDSDCTSLTCTTSILGKTITTKIKLDTCKTDISATVTLDASGVHFTKTFYGKGDVPIPGLSFGPLGSANIRFRVYRSGSNVKLEVSAYYRFERKR